VASGKLAVEVTLEGAEVVGWLQRVGVESARPVIVGCGFDDGETDCLLKIIDVEHESSAFVCELRGEIRRVSLRRVQAGYLQVI
jgi:hypothetical protein